MRPGLGNDVVDLDEPGAAGKERDQRFLERVFTPREIATILGSGRPTLTLWSLWAAKEAAFKALSKALGVEGFSPRRFEVEGNHVSVGDRRLSCDWRTGDGFVHCVAGPDPRAIENAWTRVELFEPGAFDVTASDPLEAESCHSPESHAVRALARRLLRELGLPGASVVRDRRHGGFGPPRARLGGAPVPGIDLSLSHDGRWLAVAMGELDPTC